jgi:hypothetical protein
VKPVPTDSSWVTVSRRDRAGDMPVSGMRPIHSPELLREEFLTPGDVTFGYSMDREVRPLTAGGIRSAVTTESISRSRNAR